MTGQELKEKILLSRIPFTEIAAKTGIAPQSLNSTFKCNDVRSNTIERIAQAMGVDMSYFYPVSQSIVHNVYKPKARNMLENGTINDGTQADVVSQLLTELSELRKTNQQLMQKLLEK